VSLHKIAELMGNSLAICRKHYAALIPEQMRDVVEFEVEETASFGGSMPVASMFRQILNRLDGEGAASKPQLRVRRFTS
jgi:hypothetical protein